MPNDPIHLLGQMIETFMERAEDLSNTASDKLKGPELDRNQAPLYATAAFTIRMLIADLIRIRGWYVEAHCEDLEGLLEDLKVESDFNDAHLAQVVPLLTRIRNTPIPGEDESVAGETIGSFVDRHTKGDSDA